MSKFVTLKWEHFEYKKKNRIKSFLFSSKISVFDIFFKTLCKEIFENLQINGNGKLQTHATISHKMAAI